MLVFDTVLLCVGVCDTVLLCVDVCVIQVSVCVGDTGVTVCWCL